jgi:phage-related protein
MQKSQWTVEFLNALVEAEFSVLPEAFQASILRIASLIREYGLENVGMPYIRHVEGKIWEMRGWGRDGTVRCLYVAATGRRVVILRSFVKKTRATPHEELQRALKRAKEVL